MPVSKSLLPALSACCIALPCAAQDAIPATSFDEIVVTASRVPQPLRHVAASLSLLDGRDLQAHGNLALQDILRQTPGVSVASAGGPGQTAGLRVRGEEAFRTLVILDGIRLLDPAAPQVAPQFEHLLSSGLDRVEVLRGPLGLGYGADAGGVVNISTRPATRALELGLDAQRGAYGTRNVAANASGGNPRADFTLLFSDFATDGFNAQRADTYLQDADAYANTTLHGRAGLALGDALRVELTHRRVRGETEFDGCFHPTDFTQEPGHDCLGDYTLAASRAALTYTGSAASHTLAYATTSTDRASFAFGLDAFASAGELERWEYLGNLQPLAGFTLVYGADHEAARNNGIARDNSGVFGEALGNFFDALHVGLGLRHDSNDDFGDNTSYRASAAYLRGFGADATLKFKGSYGTGLRAPSPYEIAYNSGAWSFPPAAQTTLRQETSKGYEAGIEYLHDAGLHLGAVYFSQDVADAIYFDLANFSGYLQYDGASRSRGVELAAELPLSAHWRIHANYTRNVTEQPNGLPRPRRPRHQYNAGSSWTALDERLAFNVFYRAAREALDETANGLVALDDFGVLDANASYRLGAGLQVYLRVENLLDAQYEELNGYNTADRAAYVGFRLGLHP